MRPLFLLFLAFPLLLTGEILWNSSAPKPFAVTIKISSDQVPLDDFLHLEATFHYPSDYQLDVEGLLDQLAWSANPLAPQLILQQTTITAATEREGVITRELRAAIRPQAVGTIAITFLNIVFQPKANEKKPLEILTPVFTIQVLSPSSQTALTYAPLIPLDLQFPLGLTEANRQYLWESPEREASDRLSLKTTLEQHTFPWLTFMMAIGLGGLGWSAYVIRDHLPKWKGRTAPRLSSKQVAEHALINFKSRYAEQNIDQVQAAELTSILLSAVQDYAGRPLTQLTTEEINRTLRDKSTLSINQKANIQSQLNQLDQIKFAKKIPSADASKQLLQEISSFISASPQDKVQEVGEQDKMG